MSEEEKYRKTLSKFGIVCTEKSKEIIEAFDQIKNKNASPISFNEYLEILHKSRNKR